MIEPLGRHFVLVADVDVPAHKLLPKTPTVFHLGRFCPFYTDDIGSSSPSHSRAFQ
jgi:hypothetical protein